MAIGGGFGMRAGDDTAFGRRAVTAGIVLLAVAGGCAATQGFLFGALAVAAAGGVLLLALIGREQTGVLVLMGAFALAPAYKGISPSVGTAVTPMDFLLVAGIMIVAPSLLSRHLQLPPLYLLGLGMVLVTGSIGTLDADSAFESILQFVQWLVVLAGLVCFVALWRPSWKVVDLLLWSFVAGQMASLATAFLDGPVAGTNRYQGLSHHPNAFAEGALMAFAALLYLFHRHRWWVLRVAIVLCALGCAEAVVLSGSRAALVVIGGLMVMVPFVERSAIAGFVWAILAGIAVNLLPLFVHVGGAGSALSRLAGTSDAAGADDARSHAFATGWKMFLDHPLLGNGFGGVVNELHNLYLSAAVGGGIFCLAGYLIVLSCFARPIFGNHPRRRLGYLAWAFIALTPTVPGLDDRTLWLPMALVILLALPRPSPDDASGPASRTIRGTTQGTTEGPAAGPSRRPAGGADALVLDDGTS